MSRRPNFLCIVTDQQRADHLGCMGNAVLRTPNIDRIAAEGVVFDRAYVNNPLCMPGRATMFTGMTPRGHRVRTNGINLDPYTPTVTGALANAGYRTHGVGKFHLCGFGTPRGVPPEKLRPEEQPESQWAWTQGGLQALPLPYYGLHAAEFVGGHGSYWGDYLNRLKREHPDAVPLLDPKAHRRSPDGAHGCAEMALPEELHPSTWIADRAVAFLEAQARGGPPFFLWCSFPDPHHPYWAPRPYATLYDPTDVPGPAGSPDDLELMPPHYAEAHASPETRTSGLFGAAKDDLPGIRTIIAHTFGMIALIDRSVGRILDALERLGLAGDTVISYFSDHGDMMGDHGLIRKGPYHYEGLLRVPMLWRWPGVFRPRRTAALASLLDFAPTVLDLAGVPVPEGPTPAEPECPRMPPPWPGVSLGPVLRGEAQSVQESVVVENDEDYLGLRLRTLITDRFKVTVYPGRPYGELFDVAKDPEERTNLWAEPSHRALRSELCAQLLERLVLTDSALPRRMQHA